MSQLDRYHRQMLLPGFGEAGQRRLLAAHVLIVGCGALGCSIADLLARAGVGTITIVDRDVVELTNLQRQTLFDAQDAINGIPKAEAARRRLERVNPGVRLRPVIADFVPGNAERILKESGATLLLDGTDNFETRYLLNDLAVKHGLPYIYGGAVGTQGMCMTVLPGRGPCLRCLFEEPPPPGTTATCDTAGVFGPVVSIVGACQASDAIKLLTGHEGQVPRSLLDFDVWQTHGRRVELAARRPECVCCGQHRFEFLDGARGSASAALCGQNAVQIAPPAGDARVDLGALASRLASHGTFHVLGTMLLRGTFDREKAESGNGYSLTVFADGRAIIGGTARPEVARTLYAKYVGG